MAVKRYITDSGLRHFLEKLRTVFASKEDVPVPPGDDQLYWNGQGEWTKPAGTGGGGGSAGPLWLEVDENGDLYAYYDDGSSAPLLELDKNGDLYAIFNTDE